jgi:hypothetical protein
MSDQAVQQDIAVRQFSEKTQHGSRHFDPLPAAEPASLLQLIIG